MLSTTMKTHVCSRTGTRSLSPLSGPFLITTHCSSDLLFPSTPPQSDHLGCPHFLPPSHPSISAGFLPPDVIDTALLKVTKDIAVPEYNVHVILLSLDHPVSFIPLPAAPLGGPSPTLLLPLSLQLHLPGLTSWLKGCVFLEP